MVIPNIASIHVEEQKYIKTFAHKEFILHQAQGLFPNLKWEAYNHEELNFLKTVREVSIDKVPKNLKVITRLVIYKVIENEDTSLKIKDRIAPHENEDDEKGNLKILLSMPRL